ncbi:MAG: hypothetical protein ACLFWL_10270 [Candidatus Brocadiia bacterium]
MGRLLRIVTLTMASIVIVVAIFMLYIESANGKLKTYGKGTEAIFSVCLRGKAEGGQLIAYRIPQNEWGGGSLCYVLVNTENGDGARAVGKKIKETAKKKAIGDWGAFGPLGAGNCLFFSTSEVYTFGGTERGLDLPAPPVFLSGSSYEQGRHVRLHWRNGDDPYDKIGFPTKTFLVEGDRTHLDTSKEKWLPPIYRRRWFGVGYTNVARSDPEVAGVEFRGTPSPAMAVHINGHSQEELYAIPFAGGLAPNWLGWVHGGSREEDLKLCEGTRKRVLKALEGHTVKKPEEKPFYQIIRPKAAGVSGGIWRKFLGLTPGHKYRVSVILSTLKKDEAEGDWAFSFHAIPDGAAGKDLTPKQMAGKTALPDGSSGPKAGRIVRYDADHTTEGKWIKSTTAPDDRSPGREIGDITLPEGVTSISLWARHSGENSTGVGYLWVKLEDLSMELPEETE